MRLRHPAPTRCHGPIELRSLRRTRTARFRHPSGRCRLESEFSERNRARPAHVRDFDVKFGLHNLRDLSETPARRTWITPVWQNFLFLGFLLILIGSVLSVVLANPNFRSDLDSPWTLLFAIFVGLLVTVISLALVGGALHRGRLVLDRNAGMLRFYRRILWPRPVWQLRLDDIRALAIRNLELSGVDSNDTASTYRILVAELRDGRLASIAFNSTPSISTAIRDAVGPRRLGTG